MLCPRLFTWATETNLRHLLLVRNPVLTPAGRWYHGPKNSLPQIVTFGLLRDWGRAQMMWV